MRNKIIILAPFINFPSESGFNRFYYIVEKLSTENDVTLVTSNFSHIKKAKRNVISIINENSKFDISFVNEIGYNSNFSLRRFLSILSCEINLVFWLIRNRSKIKGAIVYTGYPLIFYNLFLGSCLRSTYKALYIDIQDIWPHSIESVLKTNYPVRWLLNLVKSFIFYFLKRANGFFAVSESYADYIMQNLPNALVKVVYIGADYEYIASIPIEYPEIRGKYNLFYIGTLSYSYDIDCALKAFNIFYSEGKDFYLHIFGSGPDFARLKSMASPNVIFYGNVKYDKMIALCKSMDIALNLISNGAPQSITNKFSDYIALNRTIITSKGNKEVEEIVSNVGGYFYDSGDPISLENSIRKAICTLSMKDLRLFDKYRNKFDRGCSYELIFDLFR